MLRHWKLARDPFAGPAGPYVPTPSHEEAVARLVHAARAHHRRVDLHAPAGHGKSVALERALADLRGPEVRVSRVRGPSDGAAMFRGLAAGLGVASGPEATRAEAWRRLVDAARLCRAQGLGVVLAVDDPGELVEPADRRDLERLDHVDPDPRARVTVVRVGRRASGVAAGSLAVRLPALTRSEADDYLDAKLRASGRAERAFSPRAVARLHAMAGGVPSSLDRLASLALWSGAARESSIIGPEDIDIGVDGAV